MDVVFREDASFQRFAWSKRKQHANFQNCTITRQFKKACCLEQQPNTSLWSWAISKLSVRPPYQTMKQGGNWNREAHETRFSSIREAISIAQFNNIASIKCDLRSLPAGITEHGRPLSWPPLICNCFLRRLSLSRNSQLACSCVITDR